jgi:outer membrane lipoprotein-sorting protein
MSVAVWIDVKTGLPVKRVVTTAKDTMTVVETYRKLTLDAQPDVKKFELPDSEPPSVQAEHLFQRMEETLAEAKTLECVFEMKSPRSGSVGLFSMEGTLFLAEENRARLEIHKATKEQPMEQLWVSNGTRWSIQIFDNAQAHVQNTPGDLNHRILTWLARPGLCITQGVPPDVRVADEKDRFPVSSFKLGSREKIGDRETQRLEYHLSIQGQNDSYSITLWLDVKTGLPVKRTTAFGAATIATETYLTLILDKQVDAKKFDLPE